MVDILIVDDNTEIAEMTSEFLRREGYSTAIANDGNKALSLYEKYGAKLVLLDVTMPGMDGFAVCSAIREKSNTPIFVISARTDKEDKLNGLILGADDYIEKPVDIDILTAKIKGIFKRRYSSDVLTDGNLSINKAMQTVSVDGKQVDVTVKEFELLALLMENKGTTMKKEFLFNSIWGSDSDSEMQTLTVHIKWLREKIEEDPKKPVHILTVWGVGYRYE